MTTDEHVRGEHPERALNVNQQRSMDPQERVFLEAVERGDKHTVARSLQGSKPVNVNARDMMGRSAIQIAVDNENVELVELLLKQSDIQIGDALLYAVREGVYRIVEMLIDHPTITTDMLGGDWSNHKSAKNSADYAQDISPIILAAHCNQFEILQLLLARGARIERPHALTCQCDRCTTNIKRDSLRHSLLRIHTYRALASPAWISLTSFDPVLTAFKLSWELKHLAARENEFKDLYAELSEQCRTYACGLLDQCRSTEEVIAVLNKSSEEEDEDEIDWENVTLDRLKMALKYEQKQFVAHPHCQQLLASIWYAGIPGWRHRNPATKTLIIISLIALMPSLAILYLIFPKSQLAKLTRTPFMKFMYHSASFGCFLFLLFLVSTNVSADEADRMKRQNLRGPAPSILELCVVLYVVGFIWAEVKQLWEEGLQAYMREWWNWLDFIMLSLYLATFSLRTVAYYHSHYPEHYGPVILDRNHWPQSDPTLVSEGVFAVANVFSFARIIFLFQANPQLGPLQISLGCMLIDIGKFLLIFFLVLISFACGLNQLYNYYSATAVDSAAVAVTSDSSADVVENAFDPIWNSLMNLFWALFGLTPLSTVREGDIQPFTKLVGEGLLMAYHAMAIIMLINMLIAMMSSSFQTIEDHADREWKFARTKLWMGYFDEGSTLPSPFNLIISPKSIYYFILNCREWWKEFKEGEDDEDENDDEHELSAIAYNNSDAFVDDFDVTGSPSYQRMRDADPRAGVQAAGSFNKPMEDSRAAAVDHEVPLARMISFGSDNQNQTPRKVAHGIFEMRSAKPKYRNVMQRLVNRFIYNYKKKMRQDGVNEDDILEIKQDISSLRYEFREDRKRETARMVSSVESLKRDLTRSVKACMMASSAAAATAGGHQAAQDSPALSLANAVTEATSREPLIMDATDLDYLKDDVIGSLRTEMRDIMRDLMMTSQTIRYNQAVAQAQLPVYSELYQTHLYTQL